MVRGQFKSRTYRRVFVKTPSNRVVRHFEKRRPSKSKCASCGHVLAGMPHVRARELARLSKSVKRPQRPFGGQLCSPCSRREHVILSRSIR